MENQITTVPVALLKLMPDRECSVVNFPGRLFGLLQVKQACRGLYLTAKTACNKFACCWMLRKGTQPI